MPVFTRPNSETEVREAWSASARTAARLARELSPKRTWDQLTPQQKELLKRAFKEFYAGGDKNFETTRLARAIRSGQLTGRRIQQMFTRKKKP